MNVNFANPYMVEGKPASVAQLAARPNVVIRRLRFDPRRVRNILSRRLIKKYFIRSFSPFCWFKKGSC